MHYFSLLFSSLQMLIPSMERERPPTQIIVVKLIKASSLIHVHGLPPVWRGGEVSTGCEEGG